MTTEVKKSQYNTVTIEVTGNVVKPPQSFITQAGDKAVGMTLACNNVYNGKTAETWYVECVFLRQCAAIAENFNVGDLISTAGMFQPSEIKPTWTDDKNQTRNNNAAIMVVPLFEEGKVGTTIPVERRYRKGGNVKQEFKPEMRQEPRQQVSQQVAPQSNQMDAQRATKPKVIRRPVTRIMNKVNEQPRSQRSNNQHEMDPAMIGELTQNQISDLIATV